MNPSEPTTTSDPSATSRAQRTIVVGVDHSDASRSALEWALQFAGTDDRIVAVHVWDLPVVVHYDITSVVDAEEVGMAARSGLAGILGAIDDDRMCPIVRQGHPGRELIAVAAEEGADLLVVGPAGHGRISMMLGSTASYLLHHAPKPVVVFRGEVVAAPRTVLVGVDDHGDGGGDRDDDGGDRGGDDGRANESVGALRWAYGIPGVERIDVVHSWQLPPIVMGTFAIAIEIEPLEAAAFELVDRVIDAAGPAPDGVEVRRLTTRGSPGYALVDESRHADLVVVGSRGHGGFAGVLLGSTSATVATHAHAPVVVVR